VFSIAQTPRNSDDPTTRKKIKEAKEENSGLPSGEGLEYSPDVRKEEK